MKAYLVGGERDEHYCGTLKEAHDKAKDYVAQGNDWRDVGIEEVEVPTEKENIVFILNGVGIVKRTGRKWEFKSPRLGLEEIGGDNA